MCGRPGRRTLAIAIAATVVAWTPASARAKPKRPGGECPSAFNPGTAKLLVIGSRHPDWSGAWKAAQAQRRKKAPAEVAPASLFAGQAPGWLVLLGGKSERALADAIAATQPGAQVVEAALAPEIHGPPVKPAGTIALPGAVWDVAGDLVTIVEGRDIAIVKPRPGGRPAEPVTVERGVLRADAHLAVVQKGDLYVLDEEANWFRMVDGKPLGPLRAPDAKPPAEAQSGEWRFRRLHGPPGARGFLVERGAEAWGLLHLGFLEPFGSDGSIAGLPFAGDGTLTIAYGRDLHRFEIAAEPPPPRLVKVCGKVEASGAPRAGLRPLRVGLGNQDLVTGEDGRFETWTGEWGIVRLGLRPDKDTVLTCGAGKREFGPWNPGLAGGKGEDPVDVPLWSDETVAVRIQARCGKQ